jgi:hypothetical protein
MNGLVGNTRLHCVTGLRFIGKHPISMTSSRETHSRFLSGGIILVVPLLPSRPILVHNNPALPAVSRDAPPTLSYTTLEMASRALLSSQNSARHVSRQPKNWFDKTIVYCMPEQVYTWPPSSGCLSDNLPKSFHMQIRA